MPDPIHLPDAPDLPGLRFRRFAGEEDFPRMLAVINAAKVVDQDERSDTVEQVASTYRHLVNSDPYTDMCFAEVDGRVVGYSRVSWGQELSGVRIYSHFCFLDPAWRNQGIGGAMLHWNMGRLSDIAGGHSHGEKWLEAVAVQTDKGGDALLRLSGYQPITYGASMVRPNLDDIPVYALPEGLEVRPVEPDQVRGIWEADQEAFRDHWGFQEATEEDWQRFLEFPHTETTLWKVAWDGDRVAGQVKSFVNRAENEEYGRKRGYTEFISTTREYRRKGVARALIAASLRELRDRGMKEAALGVHTENPNGAFQLYESMGFAVVQMWTTYRRPL